MKKTTCARLAVVAATAGCVMFWGMTPSYALEGTADNHYTVEIREGDTISENIYGNNGNPVNEEGDITGAVYMTGGTVRGDIYGGRYMERSKETHRVKIILSTFQAVPLLAISMAEKEKYLPGRITILTMRWIIQ